MSLSKVWILILLANMQQVIWMIALLFGNMSLNWKKEVKELETQALDETIVKVFARDPILE